MNMEPHRRVFMETAHSCLNVPYEWGGNNPLGLDCSGFVCWCLKRAGMISRRVDMSADGLWHKYKAVECDGPIPGALVFWFDGDGDAIHIGICKSELFYYAAEGGGRLVKTPEDADMKDAFVGINAFATRSGVRRYAYPWGATT